MKKIFIAMIGLLAAAHCTAQIKWSEENNTDKIGWDNYSTTFIGNTENKGPLLVAAIP